MKTLQLVTSRSPIFKNQEKILEMMGVETSTVSVPRPDDNSTGRSLTNYVHYSIQVQKKSIKNFDLVHANYGLTAPFALTQVNRPIVLTLWGSDLAGRYDRLTKICAKYCDEVIVRNEEMRRELGRDAHIIPSGVDLEQFKPLPKLDTQREVGWDPSKKHVLFPYSPSRSVKNYPLAERVVEQVDDKCSDEVCLQTVYGIDHDDVPTYMNAADALLLTSHREGSPNTVKEAMACNLPVVATDVGDVRELLSDVSISRVCTSEEGLIVALHQILEGDSRPEGRDHVRDLSLDRMGERIVEVYEKALK